MTIGFIIDGDGPVCEWTMPMPPRCGESVFLDDTEYRVDHVVYATQDEASVHLLKIATFVSEPVADDRPLLKGEA